MALFPGDNVAVVVSPRRQLLSGTDPAVFPAPEEAWPDLFTDSRVVLHSLPTPGSAGFTEVWLVGPAFPTATGGGRQAERILAYGNALQAGEFKSGEVQVTFGGDVPADLSAIATPGLELHSFGATGLARADIRGRLGLTTTQNAAWIRFDLYEGTSQTLTTTPANLVTSTLTITIADSDADILSTGPASPVQGRLDVRSIEVDGTGNRDIVLQGRRQTVSLGLESPVEGKVRLIGVATLIGADGFDLDGWWTVDGQRWRLEQAEMRDRGTADVRLLRNSGG